MECSMSGRCCSLHTRFPHDLEGPFCGTPPSSKPGCSLHFNTFLRSKPGERTSKPVGIADRPLGGCSEIDEKIGDHGFRVPWEAM
jgi:hypothetical protein